jgi:hypothetical protein
MKRTSPNLAFISQESSRQGLDLGAWRELLRNQARCKNGWQDQGYDWSIAGSSHEALNHLNPRSLDETPDT